MQGQFTAENAAEMGRRSVIAKKQRLEELRLAVQIAVTNPAIDFAQRTLARVRLQMEKVADEIDKAIGHDSKRLKELTDSYARLADQERILAGRPMPGSLKPTTARRNKSSHEVIETESPAPIEPPPQVDPPTPFTEP